MKLLIDTNIIMDVLTKREPHFESSSVFLKTCGKKIKAYIIASQTTDIFYLLRRAGLDSKAAKDAVLKIVDDLEVLSITSIDVQNALNSDMSDYEDALLAYCAKRIKASFIITRNDRDFILSPVAAISPSTFLLKHTHT